MATATHLLTDKEATAHPPQEAVVVRFAGDSGDGMQLTGGQFTLSTALAGNDLRSEERRVGKECRSRWSPYH